MTDSTCRLYTRRLRESEGGGWGWYLAVPAPLRDVSTYPDLFMGRSSEEAAAALADWNGRRAALGRPLLAV